MKRITFILAVLCTFGIVGLLRAESDAGVKGAEAGAATFYLYADQGDDDADKAYIQMGADGTLVINIDGTNVMTMTSAGALTVVGDQTFAGTIDVDAITVNASAGIDTKTAGKLVVGAATATSLDLGAADIDTTVLGPLNVLEATGKGVDTTGAGALYLGEAVATSVVLGASDANTTVAGDLVVTGLDIDSAAGAMTVGKATATSLALGAADITTTINGTTVAGGALWLGTNGYFQVSAGALEFVGYNDFTNTVDADITQ